MMSMMMVYDHDQHKQQFLRSHNTNCNLKLDRFLANLKAVGIA